ncbi:MAG: hypothetical protein ACJAXL_000867 [Alphaproteobacteria bacterium]|jgi:hypothetical protein
MKLADKIGEGDAVREARKTMEDTEFNSHFKRKYCDSFMVTLTVPPGFLFIEIPDYLDHSNESEVIIPKNTIIHTKDNGTDLKIIGSLEEIQ